MDNLVEKQWKNCEKVSSIRKPVNMLINTNGYQQTYPHVLKSLYKVIDIVFHFIHQLYDYYDLFFYIKMYIT